MSEQVTIHAQLVDKLGLAQTRTTVISPGPWPQRVETRIRSCRLDPTQWRRHQQASTLNLQHDPERTVGRLVALERARDGALWGTWQSSELELLKDAATPWYMSAEAFWQGSDAHASDIRLIGAAIVRNPGAVSIRPAMLLVGRLDEHRDRQRWRLTGDVADRIERAAEQLKRRRSVSDPITIHDEPHARAMQRSLDEAIRYRSTLPHTAASRSRWQTPPQDRPGWEPGQLEWSRHAGSVIRVS